MRTQPPHLSLRLAHSTVGIRFHKRVTWHTSWSDREWHLMSPSGSCLHARTHTQLPQKAASRYYYTPLPIITWSPMNIQSLSLAFSLLPSGITVPQTVCCAPLRLLPPVLYDDLCPGQCIMTGRGDSARATSHRSVGWHEWRRVMLGDRLQQTQDQSWILVKTYQSFALRKPA